MKDCPPGKIHNPKSGRCVRKSGKTAQKLGLARKPTKDCLSKTKVLNPATGRCISATGKTAKQLGLTTPNVMQLYGEILTVDMVNDFLEEGSIMTIKIQHLKPKITVEIINHINSQGILTVEVKKDSKSAGLHAGDVFDFYRFQGEYVGGSGADRIFVHDVILPE